MDSVSEVLSKAADVLEERGWTNCGDWQDDITGCLCAEGAIAIAKGILFLQVSFSPEGKLLAKMLTGSEYGIIPDWNDAPERTAEEVVAKLREASALARDPGSAE